MCFIPKIFTALCQMLQQPTVLGSRVVVIKQYTTPFTRKLSPHITNMSPIRLSDSILNLQERGELNLKFNLLIRVRNF